MHESDALLADYARLRVLDMAKARDALLGALARQPPQAWLDCARALALRRDFDCASAVLSAALALYPAAPDLLVALAGVRWQNGEADVAEALLRDALARDAGDVGAAFLLAKILKEQARMRAAADVVNALLDTRSQPLDIVIAAVELLDDCGRKHDAARACERLIDAGSTDPRLHAYAAMLEVQTGDFARARAHYVFALENDPRATEWQCASGLAACQRYVDPAHADIALFNRCLDREGQGPKARASILFALGKAHDDLGAYAQAADCFRSANALVDSIGTWSRKAWRRAVDARLNAKPLAQVLAPSTECVPVFIVGMPRSGTTLVAELLARDARVRHRGELTWLAVLAQRLALAGKPTRALLESTAAAYLRQLREDDRAAHWYIDKQPLNFLHVDLIAALFPHARILWCERDGRDTALSIWMQYFAGAEQGFAYDFGNIHAVMNDAKRLQSSAQSRYPDMIRTIGYESLAHDPVGTIGEGARWIGVPDFDASAQAANVESTISTSSAWQARQSVHTRSIGRARDYVDFVPELKKFPAQN